MTLLLGSSAEIYTSKLIELLDVVSWDVLKSHLKLNDDADKSIIEMYLKAAISYCEQYTQRNLAPKTVTMYYQPEAMTDIHIQLKYHTDTDIAVKYIDQDGYEHTHDDIVLLPPDKVAVSNLPSGWKLLTATYTPKLYEDIDGIMPAILMKVGEMHTYREDGSTPKVSSIISILNRHRIKRHY